MKSEVLANLDIGVKATVVEIVESTADQFAERAMEMGILKGSPIEVAHRAPFGGAVAIRCRGALIAIRNTEANRIKVTRL